MLTTSMLRVPTVSAFNKKSLGIRNETLDLWDFLSRVLKSGVATKRNGKRESKRNETQHRPPGNDSTRNATLAEHETNETSRKLARLMLFVA